MAALAKYSISMKIFRKNLKNYFENKIVNFSSNLSKIKNKSDKLF
ncbi:hypothetical protein HMP0015_0342 [Acinetobacter haemolyticus ATCC 19194]|uniref:Uncharacterized protein n=1 Tax=Acinetobacter haemolyticus ATCC 19194 TaxID=707232 RepID=D4XKV0_ACIHA|nr:hypothetical protein HMPREF0023_2116 [Acinetobacter sp. ATCC 27244]EFF84202.1 hypothetical protein HMP0015_0342 [Acinetobacter haemolyticus ATCC 19194]